MKSKGDRLEAVVRELANPMIWNWCTTVSWRGAADTALELLYRNGLIEHRNHPYGGNIWRVNGKLFGRTDGITNKKFDSIKTK